MSGRIADHCVAYNHELPLRPVQRDFSWCFAGGGNDVVTAGAGKPVAAVAN